MPKQNISPADYPQAVLRQIAQLAQNIVVARKRRGESRAHWAAKLGVSLPTMARIERGDPSVAMASYVMCLWLINQAEGLADLISPLRDHAALEREVSRVTSSKARSPRQKKRLPSPEQAVQPAGAANASGEGALSRQWLNPPSASDALQATYGEAARQAALGIGQEPANATAAGLAALLGHPRPRKK